MCTAQKHVQVPFFFHKKGDEKILANNFSRCPLIWELSSI